MKKYYDFQKTYTVHSNDAVVTLNRTRPSENFPHALYYIFEICDFRRLHLTFIEFAKPLSRRRQKIGS